MRSLSCSDLETKKQLWVKTMANEVQNIGNSNNYNTQDTWADYLNQSSEKVLDTFASWGDSYKSATSYFSNGYATPENAGNTLSNLSAANSGVLAEEAAQISTQLRNSQGFFKDVNQKAVSNYVQKFQSAGYAQGAINRVVSFGAKGASFVGNTLAAATGVGDALSILSAERQSGSKAYPETMKSAAKSVAQISWGYAAGSASAAVAASVLGVGLAPVAIGAAAGVAGAWALGQFLK